MAGKRALLSSLRSWAHRGTVFAALLLLHSASAASAEPTSFEKDLHDIDTEISTLKDQAFKDPIKIESVLKYTTAVFQRASLSGLPQDATTARKVVEQALLKTPHVDELHFIKAALAVKHHRLGEAEEALKQVPQIADSPGALGLKGDLELQRGRYTEAGKAYSASLLKKVTWDGLARMAYFKNVRGDSTGADAMYAQAEDKLTGKEMGSYAWVELQRGYWELTHGRFDQAANRYQRAQRAYSGFWMTSDYLAELLGAEGKFDEAAVLYEAIVAQVPRPELAQALGDLYLYAGKPNLAKPWHDRALAGYLESVGSGAVEYYHHLSGFYADVRHDGGQAVKWAKKDLEIRGNFTAHDTMAWAYFRNQQFAEALKESREALKPGILDPTVLSHAGLISLAAGKSEEGKKLLRRAAEVNPKLEAFHVHR